MHSALGQAWWQRYENERWRVLDRTNTIGDPDDPDTWGQRAYMAKVLGHFQASLEARDTLVELPVHVLDGLLDPAGEAPATDRCTTCWHIGRWPCSPTRRPAGGTGVFLDQEKDFACSSPLPIPAAASGLRLLAVPGPALYRDHGPAPLVRHRPDALVDVGCNDWPSCANTVCCLTRTTCTWTR